MLEMVVGKDSNLQSMTVIYSLPLAAQPTTGNAFCPPYLKRATIKRRAAVKRYVEKNELVCVLVRNDS